MKSLKKRFWRLRLRRSLRRISVARSESRVLPEEFGEWVHIEWLLLRPDGIQLLETLEGAGRLIAGDLLPEWTQVNAQRFVFPNPLPNLERKLAAVREQAGKVPVSCLLVLSDGLEFARARPRNVILQAELGEILPPLASHSSIPAACAEAWNRLLAASRPE